MFTERELKSTKGIIWDFGGVITESPLEAFNRYELENNLPLNIISKVNSTNPDSNAWALLESSKISLEEFDQMFLEESEKQGYPIRGSSVLPLLSCDVRPKMVAMLKALSHRYVQLCLTNNMKFGHGSSMSDNKERAEHIASVMNIFDYVIESRIEGLRKPDLRIYQLACKRMKLEPSEILYLDDLGINLKPARSMGMITIKVISEEQAMSDLAEIVTLN